MAPRTIPAMHSQHIHRQAILDLRLGNMPSSRIWTLGIHNKSTLYQRHLAIPRMLHHRKHSSTTRHLKSQDTRRLWFLRPAMVAMNLCDIMMMSPHRCHHRQSARCQRLHNSTRDQLRCLVMGSQGMHSHQPTTGAMETALNLRDGRSMAGLSRSTTHRFTGYIEAFECLWCPWCLFGVRSCTTSSDTQRSTQM